MLEGVFFEYCKFGNFARILFLAKTNSRLGHDLAIYTNDRVISPFHEDFIFSKFRENKALAKVS